MSVARTPRLLVASDYDGTMAPIVSDPAKAFPDAESVRALRALASLPSTASAVISGRALRDLATLSRLPVEVQLVGSHGSEFDVGFVHEIDDDAKRLLREITHELLTIAAAGDGIAVETKPASVALHVRNASPEVADAALAAVRGDAATWDGVQVTEGKAVIELAVIVTDKGEALDILRHREGASAAVFFGDDVTDEKAFAGWPGPTSASRSATARRSPSSAWRAPRTSAPRWRSCSRSGAPGCTATAPADRAADMLASPRSVALLTPDATLTWLCHPEPDSAAVFAHLLGGVEAGHFTRRAPSGRRCR